MAARISTPAAHRIRIRASMGEIDEMDHILHGDDGVLSSLLLGGKYKRKRERAESGKRRRVGRERTRKTSSAWANGKGALIK